MSDTKQKALDYLKSNADTKELFATTDGFLFTKKHDATEHAVILEPDNPTVERYTLDPAKPESNEGTKPTIAELKLIKEKAVADYTELFGEAPDAKLSGAKIQQLIDAKKAEEKL